MGGGSQPAAIPRHPARSPVALLQLWLGGVEDEEEKERKKLIRLTYRPAVLVWLRRDREGEPERGGPVAHRTDSGGGHLYCMYLFSSAWGTLYQLNHLIGLNSQCIRYCTFQWCSDRSGLKRKNALSLIGLDLLPL